MTSVSLFVGCNHIIISEPSNAAQFRLLEILMPDSSLGMKGELLHCGSNPKLFHQVHSTLDAVFRHTSQVKAVWFFQLVPTISRRSASLLRPRILLPARWTYSAPQARGYVRTNHELIVVHGRDCCKLLFNFFFLGQPHLDDS
jgi:hypothetical protein